MGENNHAITNEKIVLYTENELELSFFIPRESDFFDGHFPEYKLLPAVAQFEIITRFAKKYFQTERAVPKISRIKFSSPIKPDTHAVLSLLYNREKKSITFSIRDETKSERIYSQGSFSVNTESGNQ